MQRTVLREVLVSSDRIITRHSIPFPPDPRRLPTSPHMFIQAASIDTGDENPVVPATLPEASTPDCHLRWGVVPPLVESATDLPWMQVAHLDALESVRRHAH